MTFLPEAGKYHEIEYETKPIPGVGKFRPEAQKIRQPEKDPIRELFVEMRDIARSIRAHYSEKRFNNLSQNIRGFANNSNLQSIVRKFDESGDSVHASEIFNKQAVFMKDFLDNYEGYADFSHAMPYYQHMGYEQLRTYFTWRTKVRMGQVEKTSSSYILIYVFELIANIGVDSPRDGLEKLLFLWKESRRFTDALDVKMVRWVHDYYVYYQTHLCLCDFITECGLQEFYPEHDFDMARRLMELSTYDIAKSAYCTDENKELLVGCTKYVLGKVVQLYKKNGMDFLGYMIEPRGKKKAWRPFEGALFYGEYPARDAKILVGKEFYLYIDGKWNISPVNANTNGRKFLELIIRQTERHLRVLSEYKPKNSSWFRSDGHESVKILKDRGVCLQSFVEDAAKGFFYYFTKEDVKFDAASLEQIRKEAEEIQERLIIEDSESSGEDVATNDNVLQSSGGDVTLSAKASLDALKVTSPPAYSAKDLGIFVSAGSSAIGVAADSQETVGVMPPSFGSSFTQLEKEALRAVLSGGPDIRNFTSGRGIMPEVLVEGINEKALEILGDNLFDEALNIYEEYKEQAREWTL